MNKSYQKLIDKILCNSKLHSRNRVRKTKNGSHGLYTTDIKRWRSILESSFDSKKPSKDLESDLKAEKEKNNVLERDLRKKEKALAETAALLVLRKKADAIWGDPEEE